GGGEEVQKEAVAFQPEAQDRIARFKKNSELLDTLLDVTFPGKPGASAEQLLPLARPSVDEQFATAFSRWGNLDLSGPGEWEVADRLSKEPAPVVQELIAALDAWMLEQRKDQPEVRWRRLFGVLQRLDRNGQRGKLRRMLVGDDPLNAQTVKELRGRINIDNEPVLTVLLLAQAANAAADRAGAVAILRQAVA